MQSNVPWSENLKVLKWVGFYCSSPPSATPAGLALSPMITEFNDADLMQVITKGHKVQNRALQTPWTSRDDLLTSDLDVVPEGLVGLNMFLRSCRRSFSRLPLRR